MTHPGSAIRLGLTGRLARWSATHRWSVIVAWIILTAALTAASSAIGGVFTTEIEFTNEPESQRANELLEDARGALPLVEQVIVSHRDLTVADPPYQAFVQSLVDELRSHPGTFDPASVTSYYELSAAGAPTAGGLVSDDEHRTLIPVRITGDLDDASPRVAALHEVLAEAERGTDFELLTAGFASINEAFNEAAEEDLSAETEVLPLAFLILVLVFGAVIAAMVPMLTAAVAIAAAFAVVTLISEIWPLSTFVFNLVLTIGLAVGIDYALFIIERFREERAGGADRLDAIAVAGDTASRAVLFSGVTVVIALLGMLIVPTSIFRSFGAGASIVVLFSVAISLTLLPALMGLLGDRVNLVRPWWGLGAVAALTVVLLVGGFDPLVGGVTLLAAVVPGILMLLRGRTSTTRNAGGFWDGAAHTVMARPWVSMGLSAALLVLLALPLWRIDVGFAGASALPEHLEARQAFDILDRDFSAGASSPTEVVVRADNVAASEIQAGLSSLIASIQEDAALRLLPPNAGDPERSSLMVSSLGGLPIAVSEQGDLAVLSVALPGDAASDEAVDALKRVRDRYVPESFAGTGAEVLVGGQTAISSDFFDILDVYTAVVFAFVLGLSFLLLLLAFRSIVVPLKAILMNLLSVGAAYGVMVAIFQLGWGADLLGFQQVDAVEAWIPLFLFTVLFGLSMDYHVFLLSRIRERFDLTRDNAHAVAFGLRSTANIITGAAAIMVAVFAGFALADLVMFQQVGLGLAVAVFLDATVVRTVLVPATMRLLGNWNWYLPSWLSWLPDLRVEHEPARIDERRSVAD